MQQPVCGMQAFYAEFGELMMRQPVIGLDFQSYLPIAIVPYMLLLAFNVFNRYMPWSQGCNSSAMFLFCVWKRGHAVAIASHAMWH